MQMIAMVLIGIFILFIIMAGANKAAKKDKTYELKDDVIRKLYLRK